ncbi:MAG: glycoside hydrolase family 13 protein [Saprospiraceae bacterium]
MPVFFVVHFHPNGCYIIATMQFKITFFLLLFSTTFFAQTDQSIYNDDPFQKMPLGMEEPEPTIIPADGGTIDESRVEPPFWFTDMAVPTLEILIYDQSIGDYEVKIDYAGIELQKVHRVENPNYLFVEVEIGAGTKPGKFNIELSKNGQQKNYPYELRAKRKDGIHGLDNSDLMYLIMPDRFANGDSSNDSFEDMKQVGVNREKVFFRHGGDLLGVMERLDYLKNLGVTALWLNPVLENNEPFESYHGYAVTDHYNVDKRLGGNNAYLQLVKLAHERDMKIVMDIIHNHVGDQHWFIQDLPESDFIHQYEEFTQTNYRAPALMDPYASKHDLVTLTDGWFATHMPDLNQKNSHVANYLIQNNLWWIEYSGHDAYRIDTYPYPDEDFMVEWCKRVKMEYPDFTFFGEAWVNAPAIQAQFTQDNYLRDNYDSELPALVDFQMYFAINEALTKPMGWTEGVSRIYFTLAQDFLYENPYASVLFLDNHDLTRFATVMNEDMNKFKSGMALLMTMRGIPCMYYGTEIMMTGSGGGFGEGGRKEFPGGWSGDAANKFTAKGRTDKENEAFNYIQQLAKYRAATPALQTGKLTQFVPKDGIYVYFRYDADQTVMVITNSTDQAVEVGTERFKERMLGFSAGRDVVSGEVDKDLTTIAVGGHEVVVLELQ